MTSCKPVNFSRRTLHHGVSLVYIGCTHTYVHALRNYLLEHVIEGNIEGTGRRGRIRKQLLYDVSLEPFAATEFNKILSVRQPRRCVKVLQRFRMLFMGATDDLVSSTLKIGTESVPETLENFLDAAVCSRSY